jgi:hypothetical protein
MSTIDSFALMLNGPSQRHYIKWPILGTYVWPNNFIGLTYDEEINYLKTWISNRLTWLDANMVGTCSNLSSPISTIDQIKVFPNPSDHKFYIEGITHPCHARIYSQSGQLILCIPLNSFTNEISSEDLEHGMYILQIDGKTQHYKLIISHS